MARMPSNKLKPSDVASEAKRSFIPYCAANYPHFKPNSMLITQARELRPQSADSAGSAGSHLRVAVIEGDPVDVAIEWYEHERAECEAANRGKSGRRRQDLGPIPVVNTANEKRPGGDWELTLIASEENFCRRSNLVACLASPWPGSNQPHYPIPQYGGIYSPCVIVFRDGPDRGYGVWPEFKTVPAISVSPTRRPRLEESGDKYSFVAEADLMRDKMKSILRIAADHHHRQLVIGSWGLQGYRNPARHLAQMWAELLFRDDEFLNRFTEIVFVIEPASSGGGGNGSVDGDASNNDLKIFQEELDPSNNYKDGHKYRHSG